MHQKALETADQMEERISELEDRKFRNDSSIRGDRMREWHGHIYTTKRKIASGKQPHSTGRSAQCFVTTQRGGIGGWEGEARGKRYGDICICIADSLCYTAETNTPL